RLTAYTEIRHSGHFDGWPLGYLLCLLSDTPPLRSPRWPQNVMAVREIIERAKGAEAGNDLCPFYDRNRGAIYEPKARCSHCRSCGNPIACARAVKRTEANKGRCPKRRADRHQR